MSSRNRTFPNASDFTTPDLANEANTAATRDAIRGDVYGNTMTFQAVVLTQPVPMDSTQIFNLYGKDHQEGAEAVPTFQFKGRIVAGDLPSPHEFLPDPCKLDSSVNFQTTLDLVAQHTTFVSEAGYDGPPPSTGDIVEVELEAGDVKFNLQYGTFKNIVNSSVIEPGNYESTACSNLPALFSSFGGTVTAGDVSNIFEGRPRGGSIASQMVRVTGDNITNNGGHKAKPGVIQWIRDVVLVMNAVRAKGSDYVARVPHASSSRRYVPGCTAGAPRTDVAGEDPWNVTITSGYRNPESQARAMMGLRANTFGSFCLRYTIPNRDTVYHIGNFNTATSQCTETVAMGSGTANFSDITNGSRLTVSWPEDSASSIRNCASASATARKKCTELIKWAAATLRSTPTSYIADAKYRGLDNPPWGQVHGNVIRPNPVIYHIYLLYGANTRIENFLKIDYNSRGGDEATSYIEELELEGITFSKHQTGLALDLSVGGDIGGNSGRNMDFLIDICYDAGNVVRSHEKSSYPYAVQAAADRLASLGRPRDGSCFYHDNHLHLAAPTRAGTVDVSL